jgi:hypothetical protein
MQKEFLSVSILRMILAISIIVCVGAVVGLMGWMITKPEIENGNLENNKTNG